MRKPLEQCSLPGCTGVLVIETKRESYGGGSIGGGGVTTIDHLDYLYCNTCGQMYHPMHKGNDLKQLRTNQWTAVPNNIFTKLPQSCRTAPEKTFKCKRYILHRNKVLVCIARAVTHRSAFSSHNTHPTATSLIHGHMTVDFLLSNIRIIIMKCSAGGINNWLCSNVENFFKKNRVF